MTDKTTPQQPRWLNPKTALGATLPCGAVVTEAQWPATREPYVGVTFDRQPRDKRGQLLADEGVWWFFRSGRSISNIFDRLTPPDITKE